MVILIHTIHAFAHANSIAQRSPKMTVLMLDGCTLFAFDERAVEGNNHGLDTEYGDKLKEARGYLFARACTPNAAAADTGKEN